MNRIALFSLVLAAPLLLAAGNGKKSPAADPLPVGSMWVGSGEQGVGEARQTWSMAIHIDERNGNFVRASAWYPTLANGVSRLSGVLDDKGSFSVDEPSIVHGEWNKTPGGIVAGGTYVGRADSKSVSVSGSFKDPKSGASIPCKFSLARVHGPSASAAPEKPR